MFDPPVASPDTHRAFFAARGDQRQVWARTNDKPPEDFYLAEGGVTARVREQARAGELLCPIGDCPAPEFIARGGQERRHHFAHHAGHKHDPLEVQLHAAVAALGSWVAERYPRLHTTPDPAGGQLEVRWPTGRSVTIAISYKRGKLRAGERPGLQTLLGHHRGLLPGLHDLEEHPGLYGCGRIAIVDRVLVCRGSVLLLNPQERQVATLLPRRLARELVPGLAAGLAEYVIFVDPLGECELGEQGLLSPTSIRAEQVPAPAPPAPAHAPRPRVVPVRVRPVPPAGRTPGPTVTGAEARRPGEAQGLLSIRGHLGPRLSLLLSEPLPDEPSEIPTDCTLSAVHWRLLVAKLILGGAPPTVSGIREWTDGRDWAPSLPDHELARYLQHLRNTGLLAELLTGRAPG